MTVDPAHAAGHEDYQGRTYYFCSENCRARFRQNQQSFVSPEPTVPEAAVTPGAEWTCPMHPEVRRDGPGSCPICGMAL